MPKVTIIIPVYNVEQYLRECLDSALKQTMRDIEIICIDDGSTDTSSAILDEYANSDPRVQVYHEKNQGAGAARNLGLEKASGEYIVFLDADDTIAPDLCEHAYIHAKYSDDDLTLFLSKIDSLFEWTPVDTEKLSESPLTQNELIQMLNTIGWSTWGKLWKTSFLRKHEIFFPVEIRSGQDLVFAYHGALFVDKTSILIEKLYYYRYNPNSLSNIDNKKNSIIRIDPVFVTLRLYKENEASYCVISEIARTHFTNLYYMSTSLITSLQTEFDKRLRQLIFQDGLETIVTEAIKGENNNIKEYYQYILGSKPLSPQCRPKPKENSLFHFIKHVLVKRVIFFLFYPIKKIRKLSRKVQTLQRELNARKDNYTARAKEWAILTTEMKREIISLRDQLNVKQESRDEK
ncbi:MAG: glycosyltransferase family 2 protein [Planctomycetia bacterium]|nr:glycosyltransferase family 2 protein [Planctomycetia bacterium]